MLARLTILAAALASGCVVPYAVPPIRAEAGAATLSGGRDPALHAGAGAHLASGTLSRAQPFDLGIGGFGDWSEDGLAAGGVYTEAALFVERTRRTRTALGARGELRWTAGGHLPMRDDGTPADGALGVAAKLRVDHELFGPVRTSYSGSDPCGVIGGAAYGTGAIGVYAEAGHVWLPNDERAWTATAGLTVRIPSTYGLVFAIPGCK